MCPFIVIIAFSYSLWPNMKFMSGLLFITWLIDFHASKKDLFSQECTEKHPIRIDAKMP